MIFVNEMRAYLDHLLGKLLARGVSLEDAAVFEELRPLFSLMLGKNRFVRKRRTHP